MPNSKHSDDWGTERFLKVSKIRLAPLNLGSRQQKECPQKGTAATLSPEAVRSHTGSPHRGLVPPEGSPLLLPRGREI